ncbi:MAG: hypothetical protein GC199_00600 [Alphaproteobacteria bacterium]|nr:hypothetical protein [Alphaproteobacteria bacterium]
MAGPHHHPTAAHLTAYALGEASHGLSLLIETHLSFCGECRRRVAAHDAIGGALLDEATPAALAPGALEQALAAITRLAPASPDAPTRHDGEIAGLPEPVRTLARGAREAHGFSFASLGLQVLDLTAAAGAHGPERVQLLRIEPGHGSPRHSHAGEEVTLVLQGAFRDGSALFGPGDVEIGTGAAPHRPIAEPGPICFAIAVTSGNLKFTGALGLVQRLWGGEA